MKKTAKTIISAILSLCILIGIFVIQSSAATVDYNGSSSYMESKYGKALAAYELTGDQKTDVLSLAKTQLGYKEGWLAGSGSSRDRVDNLTEYNRWYYGYNNAVPWCAIWVSFILRHAGVSKQVVPNFAGCSQAVSNLSDGTWGDGVWHDAYLNGKSNYTPKTGDIVFYSWKSDFVACRYYVKDVNGDDIGQVNHVGIVTEDAESPTCSIKSIEGNASDKVCIVTQDYRDVVGYFTPNYITKEEENKLETVNIVEPQNINNAWVPFNNPGVISWDAFPGAATYQITIREQLRDRESGEYYVIDNFLARNEKLDNSITEIDLRNYDLPPASAWKVWVGAVSDGTLLAESFVYLRINAEEPDSDTSSNNTDPTPDIGIEIPNTSGEGYVTEPNNPASGGTLGGYSVNPLPGDGYQVEAGRTGNVSPSASENSPYDENRTEFEEWGDEGSTTAEPEPSEETEISPEETTSPEESTSSEEETITLLKRIISMLEILFRFFGIAF